MYEIDLPLLAPVMRTAIFCAMLNICQETEQKKAAKMDAVFKKLPASLYRRQIRGCFVI